MVFQVELTLKQEALLTRIKIDLMTNFELISGSLA